MPAKMQGVYHLLVFFVNCFLHFCSMYFCRSGTEEFVTQKMCDLRELADKKAEGERLKAERAHAAKEARKAHKRPASVAVDERLVKMREG